MAIDEQARHRLYDRLEEVLGPEEATILMEHLPPAGWGDVARKSDVDALAAATKSDLAALAAATKSGLTALAAATRSDLDGFQEANRLEHQLLEQRMLATFRAEINQQTRTMILAMITVMTTVTLAVASLAFAAFRLTGRA